MADKGKAKGGGAKKFGRNRTRYRKTGGVLTQQKVGSSEKYKTRGRRTSNKRRRIAKDAKRAVLQACGHGSRHVSPYDKQCRRCHAA